MPTLSYFYGITIHMYKENNGKHQKPHIHAVYAEDEVVVDLDGEILEGKIPRPQMKLVDAWIEIHRQELKQNWERLSKGEQYFKIKPLS